MSEEFRERGSLLATEFSQKVAEGVIIEDKNILNKFTSQLWGSKDVLYVCIHNRAGNRLIQRFANEELEKRLPPNFVYCKTHISELFSGSQSSFALLDVVAPISYENECIGYIRLGISLERISKEVNNRIINTSMLVFLFIFVGLIFSFIFSRSFSDPINRLLDGVKKIEQGDLSYNVKVINKDEVGELAVAFNQMTDRLRISNEELKEYAQDLENKVEERTVELKEINLRLEQDISARKEMERALSESKERYQMLFNHLPVGVIHFDENGNILNLNSRFAEIVGAEKEKLLGLGILEVFDDNEIKKALQDSLEGTPGFFEGNYISKFDGNDLFLKVTFDGIADEEGRFIGGVGLFEDYTGRKKVEEEKMRLQTQLQNAQKMEAIGTLAGGVAHDLNNILSGLVTYPELLLKGLSEDEPLKTPILTIQRSGKEAAAIVQDLLTLARREVMVKEVVDLNDILAALEGDQEYQKLGEAHPEIAITIRVDGSLPNINGSAVHLTKCFLSLVQNATEALSGSGTLVISTTVQRLDEVLHGYEDIPQGEYAVVTVEDSSAGMSAEEVKRIFEPFFIKKVMKRNGTGLGMAVVWGTVKDHDGYLDIPDNGRKGSRFDLFFPATSGKLIKTEAGGSLDDIKGDEKVLIVDDVEQQRQIASLILRQLGYSVTVVSSGEEAVEYLKSNSVDLVVLDMIMDPGIDGLETYRRILEIRPGQKAVIVSGFSENERFKKAREIGVGGYVKKPYSVEKIGQAVRAELDT